MSLYTRPESALWYYEFRVAGQRYRGSTGTTDKARAEAFELEQRTRRLHEAAPTGSVPPSVPAPDKFHSHQIIREGRNAWAIAAAERCRPSRNFSEASARRQRWREIGAALLEGRAICADLTAFAAWRNTERLNVPGLTRVAAMWLAENWEVVADLETKVSHPRTASTPA